MPNPTSLSPWKKLTKIANKSKRPSPLGLNVSLGAARLNFDFSRHLMNEEIFNLLLELAEEQNIVEWRNKMFAGDKINTTENRSVLHTALRSENNVFVEGQNIRPAIIKEFERLYNFAESIRDGSWTGATDRRITDLVHIGIGGSMLGVQTVLQGLKHVSNTAINIHVVANVDGADMHETLQKCNPETTLFYIASKSFTTVETMTNAETAKRWITDALGQEAVSQHFAAASTAREKVEAFGINTDNMFGFWEWVGGRFSSWSSIGLPIVVSLGRESHKEWLKGAHEMDMHFQSQGLNNNAPVLLALIGIWYRNFLQQATYTISPYTHALRDFPKYVQQIEMESNGKRIDRENNPVSYDTCPLVFGEPGTNAQHSYFQLIHQGTSIVPVDFIHVQKALYPGYEQHHQELIANASAQPDALWKGRSLEDSQNDLHREFPGRRPSTIISMAELTPHTMGALMALYEMKVFVQGVIWNINSFDQFGVELGKDMARALSQ